MGQRKGLIMKDETILKVLRRYAKGLKVMESDALSYSETTVAERYRFDAEVFLATTKIIEERSNT